MPDLLSQAEIDALIGALKTGDAPPTIVQGGASGTKVRTYDFRRPDRFSKDQLRTIQSIHAVFSRLAGMALSMHLRHSVTVSVQSVDQITYEEFSRSIPTPTVIATLALDPLEGKAMIQFSNTFALSMVDRLLGGPGSLAPQAEGRTITQVERVLIERTLNKLMPVWHEAWSTIDDVRPRLAGIETNPQFAQVAAPTDSVLIVQLAITTPKGEGILNLCLPYLLLQPIIGRLSATTLFAASTRAAQPETLQAAIEETRMPVRVELGRAFVNLGDLANLSPDDVIRLDRPIDAPVEVFVGQECLYRARPGRVRRRLAVEITSVESRSAHV